MSLSINGGSNNVPIADIEANTNGKSSGIWSKITIIFSSIRAKFSAWLAKMAESVDLSSLFFSWKQHVFSVEPDKETAPDKETTKASQTQYIVDNQNAGDNSRNTGRNDADLVNMIDFHDKATSGFFQNQHIVDNQNVGDNSENTRRNDTDLVNTIDFHDKATSEFSQNQYIVDNQNVGDNSGNTGRDDADLVSTIDLYDKATSGFSQNQHMVDNQNVGDNSGNTGRNDADLVNTIDLYDKATSEFSQNQHMVDNQNVGDNSGNTGRNDADLVNTIDLSDKVTSECSQNQHIVDNQNIGDNSENTRRNDTDLVDTIDLYDKATSGFSQNQHIVDNQKKTDSSMEHAAVADTTEPPQSIYNRVKMEVKPLPSVQDVVIRWWPTNNYLVSMIELLRKLDYVNADRKTILFESDFEGDIINNVWGVSFPISLLESVLVKKLDKLSLLVEQHVYDRKILTDTEGFQREVIAMEKIAQLLEMALKAREEKDTTKAICIEATLLAQILHIFLHEQNDVHATDKESAEKKQEELIKLCSFPIEMVMDTINDLIKRVNPSDVDRVEKEIDPVVFSKFQDLRELVYMFSTKRLSLRKMDAKLSVNCRLQEMFHKVYTGWDKLDTNEGDQLLFLRLLADTDCLDLENNKDIEICRHYAEGLDEAKRLFYRDKEMFRALRALKGLLNGVFNIQTRNVYGNIL